MRLIAVTVVALSAISVAAPVEQTFRIKEDQKQRIEQSSMDVELNEAESHEDLLEKAKKAGRSKFLLMGGGLGVGLVTLFHAFSHKPPANPPTAPPQSPAASTPGTTGTAPGSNPPGSVNNSISTSPSTSPSTGTTLPQRRCITLAGGSYCFDPTVASQNVTSTIPQY